MICNDHQVRFNGEEGCGLQEEPGWIIIIIMIIIIIGIIMIIIMIRKNSWW